MLSDLKAVKFLGISKDWISIFEHLTYIVVKKSDESFIRQSELLSFRSLLQSKVILR